MRSLRAIATLFLLAALPLAAHAQAVYTGTLGKQPIQLVVQAYSDGVVRAFYAYDKYDTPIRIDGRLDGGVLVLHEKDDAKHDVATLRFAAYSADREDVRGEWQPVSGAPSTPIRLHKTYAIDYGKPLPGPHVEMLQPASIGDLYFKVVLAKEEDRDWPRVTAVNLYRKRSDALVQSFEVDTQYWYLDIIGTGDFNFDGVSDFSVFEASAAGPNTTSLYFLADPATGKYALSRISGVSLEFDPNEKRVHEHNQCCAGHSHMNAIYRVEGDRLVLESRTCAEFDEAKEELVDVPCEPEEDRD
jgi:hypothetical protein